MSVRGNDGGVLSYHVGATIVIALNGHAGEASRAVDEQLTDALADGSRDFVLDVFQVEGHGPALLDVTWSALRRVRRRSGTLTVAGASGALAPTLRPLIDEGLVLRDSVYAALSI